MCYITPPPPPPPQLSTYALTLFRKDVRLPGESKVTTIGT